MDPTTTPWRVLEDPVERPRAGHASEVTDAAHGAIPRSALLMGAGVIALVVLAFGLAFGVGASGSVVLDGGTPLGSAPAADGSLPSPGPSSPDPELVVEIVGAIDRPGVFRLPAGARVGDLVEAAGGYGSRVDAERASRELNLAAFLHDGDQVRVPSRDDEETAGVASAVGSQSGDGGTSGSSSSGGSGLVNLNSATAGELETLPGIGPVTAAKILASRDEQAFAAVEDLRTRGVLGEKTFEKVRDLVTVR
jgi:competence protein ComEA